MLVANYIHTTAASIRMLLKLILLCIRALELKWDLDLMLVLLLLMGRESRSWKGMRT